MATRKKTNKSALTQAADHLGTASLAVGTALAHKFADMGDAMSASLKTLRNTPSVQHDQVKRQIAKVVKRAAQHQATLHAKARWPAGPLASG